MKRLFEIQKFLDMLSEAVEIRKELLKKYFVPRIDSFINLSKFFVIEKYTQKEWKDLISLHFINTTYNFSKEAIRIHFFTNDEIALESYLGFITLRNLPEVAAILSYAFPNFSTFLREYKKKFVFNDLNFYIMTYDKKVHIGSEELVIKTFPFYSQDGVVTRCAHADIIMVSNYLHHKWGFNKIEVGDIFDSYSFYRTKPFPSEGLLIYQIAEIFSNNKIDICIKNREDFGEYFVEILDSLIESSFPVILATKQHVCVIFGHTLFERKKAYIIYDDSGYFTNDILKKGRDFFTIISKEELDNLLDKNSYIIYPEPQRVYYPYLNIKKAVEKFIYSPRKLSYIVRERIFLVENYKIKEFLSKNTIKILPKGETLEDFLLYNYPHFLWYIELNTTKGDYVIFCGDPTRHVRSITPPFYKTFFIVKGVLGTLSKF